MSLQRWTYNSVIRRQHGSRDNRRMQYLFLARLDPAIQHPCEHAQVGKLTFPSHVKGSKAEKRRPRYDHASPALEPRHPAIAFPNPPQARKLRRRVPGETRRASILRRGTWPKRDGLAGVVLRVVCCGLTIPSNGGRDAAVLWQ